MNDDLGDRMKFFEGMVASNKLMPLLPVLIRLDGVCFHSFTKGLKRPYDERLSRMMIDTTKFLVSETNARLGYTQSDEITLLLYSEDYKSQIYYDAKISKIMSILAAKTSVFFNNLCAKALPEKAEKYPVFDCRVWNTPNKTEAVNTIVWREQDATRNSISMAAQAYYSHNQLQGRSCPDMQELLFQKGINWNDYPSFFKRGTYIQRKTVEKPFDIEELERLPPKHAARLNPDFKVARREITEIELPPITKITNRVAVCFDGEDPICG